ncbi:MAG: peptide chain release factor N(5)-glutamine methyltransferase [Pseudomonadota bacterium]
MIRADAIAAAVLRLGAAGVPGAERDARLLYRWAAGLSGAGLQANLTEIAPQEELDRFGRAVAAREARHPVSHITGMRAFWGRCFRVTPDVLDPRPETEMLVAEGLIGAPQKILDLGTGTGCILLSLLADLPGSTGIGLDISSEALGVAAENAARLGLLDSAAFCLGSWADIPPGPYDLIVSNPPYLSEVEMDARQPELHYEPDKALSPGGDGLDAYRALIPPAADALAPKGRLLLEIGASQAKDVMALMAQAGFSDLAKHTDLDGRDRMITGQIATDS